MIWMEKDCGVWIAVLSHMIRKRMNADMQSLGLTGAQSHIMHYILVKCTEGPVFQRDIEKAFSLSRSSATGILQLMEKRGLILRKNVARDGRLKSLIPTEKAAQLDAQIGACIRQTEQCLTEGLSDAQRTQFMETAARMYSNLDG